MSYWRVILKGSLGSVESWSTSVAFGIVGLNGDTPDQAMTDAMAVAVRGTITNTNVGTALRVAMSVAATIDSVRLEKRAEDETVLNVSESLLIAPVPGTSGLTKTPQDAMVISLRTSTPGARGRGRMYWPALGTSLNNTFQITAPTQADAVAGAKTLLQAINTAMDNVYIGQASALRVALSVRSGTDHVCRDVTSIQVGSVMDTQRRRRDILPETYASVAYP